MSIEIYYFSGTGNSMHIAKELQKKIPGSEMLPIVSFLGNPNVETCANTIGFVFPIYFTTLPDPVKKFIKSLKINSIYYIFAIATRLGTPHSAFNEIDKVLKIKGRRLDAYFSITMANNDPKYDNYQTPTEDEIKFYEKAFKKELQLIVKIIKKRKKSRKKDTTITEPVPQFLVNIVPFLNSVFKPIAEFAGFKSTFYADSKCIGCGICEKVCLSGKIKMEDNKPKWKKDIKCFYCYACLNFCPNEAIQIKGFTENNERYSHPYATADDIAKQKTVIR